MSTSSSYTANMESIIFGPLSKYTNLLCGSGDANTTVCSWASSKARAINQYGWAEKVPTEMESTSPKDLETPMSSEMAQALGYTSSKYTPPANPGLTGPVGTVALWGPGGYRIPGHGQVVYSAPSSGFTTNTVTPGSVIPQGESLSTIQSEDKLDAELQFYKLFASKDPNLSTSQKSKDEMMAWGIEHYTSQDLQPGFRSTLRADLYNRIQGSTSRPKILTDFWNQLRNYAGGGIGVVEEENAAGQASYDIDLKGMEALGKIVSQDLTTQQVDYLSNITAGTSGLGAIAYQGVGALESDEALSKKTPKGKGKESQFTEVNNVAQNIYSAGTDLADATTYIKGSTGWDLAPDAGYGFVDKQGKTIGKVAGAKKVDELAPFSGGAYSMWLIGKVAKQDEALYEAQQAAAKRVTADQSSFDSAVTSALGLMQTAQTTLSSLKADNSKAFVADEDNLANVAAGYLDYQSSGPSLSEANKLASEGVWKSTTPGHGNAGSANLMGAASTGFQLGLVGGTGASNVSGEESYIESAAKGAGAQAMFSGVEDQANAFESAYSYLDTAKNPSGEGNATVAFWNKLNSSGTTSQEISNTRAMEGAFKDEWKAIGELSSAAAAYGKAAAIPASVESAAIDATTSALGSSYVADQSVGGEITASGKQTGLLARMYGELGPATTVFNQAINTLNLDSDKSVKNYASSMKNLVSSLKSEDTNKNTWTGVADGAGAGGATAIAGPFGLALAGVTDAFFGGLQSAKQQAKISDANEASTKAYDALRTPAAKAIFKKYDPAGTHWTQSETGFINTSHTKAGQDWYQNGSQSWGLGWDGGPEGYLVDPDPSKGPAKTPPKVNLVAGQWLASKAPSATATVQPVTTKGLDISTKPSPTATPSLAGRTKSSSPSDSRAVSAVSAAKKPSSAKS